MSNHNSSTMLYIIFIYFYISKYIYVYYTSYIFLTKILRSRGLVKTSAQNSGSRCWTCFVCGASGSPRHLSSSVPFRTRQWWAKMDVEKPWLSIKGTTNAGFFTLMFVYRVTNKNDSSCKSWEIWNLDVGATWMDGLIPMVFSIHHPHPPTSGDGSKAIITIFGVITIR